MKEKILEIFKALGFEMDAIEDMGYAFHYEGKVFIYMCSASDEDFLSIALPAIEEIEDEEDISVYKKMDMLNSSLKYIKAFNYINSIWLFCERELFGGEDLEQLITSTIFRLDAGYNFYHKLKDSEEGDDEEDGEDNSDSEDNV